MTTEIRERRPNPRRTIMFTDGSPVMKGLVADVNGRPLLVIEQNDGVAIRLNWTALIGLDDPIETITLRPEGCLADVTWERATAILSISGARELGQITVTALFASGETHTSVLAVRLPERFTESSYHPAGVNTRGVL